MEKFNNWTIFNQLENIDLTDDIKTKLQTYYEILVKENAKYNLTRITEINDVFEKHFLDSLLFTNVKSLTNEKIADIGTGPGFPGVVLKIFFPETKITLIESNSKKTNFLKLLINKLNLKDIKVVDERAEVYSVEHKEEYDIVISRAVAYLDIILEIGVQMLKVDGEYILLKGPRAEEEIANIKDLPAKLSLKLETKQNIKNNNEENRINLFYKKIASTNVKYPRKYNEILKKSKKNI